MGLETVDSTLCIITVKYYNDNRLLTLYTYTFCKKPRYHDIDTGLMFVCVCNLGVTKADRIVAYSPTVYSLESRV